MPSVLMYIPCNPAPDRLHGSTWRTVTGITWDGVLDITIGRHDEPGDVHHYADLRAKHNRARRLTLAGDYDALFLVEADMLLPDDILARLWAADVDVAYGLYCSRHEAKVRGGYRWLAFWYAGEQRSMTYCARPAIARFAWGRVLRTQGVGMGCTLIRRHVLDVIEFENEADYRVADDWMFSLACQRNGFEQAHDFGAVCGHILADGSNAIWPDIGNGNGERLWSIRPIEHEV